MKKIMLFILAVTLGMGITVAQTTKQETPKKETTTAKEKTTVFVTDIDCDHCAKKILDNVSSLGKGVKDVKVDVPTKEVTVTYDPAKNNDVTIIKGLASLKVKADVKPAATATTAAPAAPVKDTTPVKAATPAPAK